jgi:DNA polymerase-3 subunit beta
MKFHVERDALKNLLTGTSRIIETRNTIPILGNVLLRAADGRLTVKGTNLDQEFAGSVPAEIEVPGETTVAGLTLDGLVKKFAAGAAIAMAKKDSQLEVRSGRSRFMLQTLPVSDFPVLDTGDLSHSFEISAGDLKALIDPAAIAMSTEEGRYYLNGIFLQYRESGVLRVVATDGHRLVRTEMDAPEGSAGMPSIIIPRQAIIDSIQKWGLKADVIIKVSLSDNKVKFETPDGVLTSKVIDGTFPDYERVIPRNNDKRVIVETDAIAGAIDRVSTLSEGRGRATKLSLTAGKLVFSVTNPDAGSATEEVDVEYDSAPMDVGFNSKYLGDIFAQLKDNDTAIISLESPGAPALIQSREGSRELFVLMPLRI